MLMLPLLIRVLFCHSRYAYLVPNWHHLPSLVKMNVPTWMNVFLLPSGHRFHHYPQRLNVQPESFGPELLPLLMLCLDRLLGSSDPEPTHLRHRLEFSDPELLSLMVVYLRTVVLLVVPQQTRTGTLTWASTYPYRPTTSFLPLLI